MKNSAALDETTSPLSNQLKPFAALQAAMDLSNLLLVFVQMPKLLAQLDADNLTTSAYAATFTPTSPGDVRTKFNAMLAQLDTDAIPAGADYVATLTAAADTDLVTKWPALLAKLAGDNSGDKANYVGKNTLPFLTTIDLKARAV